MNGREHLYFSLTFFSVGTFLYSIVFDFNSFNKGWYALLLVLLFVSIVFNEIANYIYSKNKKLNKGRAKDVDKFSLSGWDKFWMYGLRIWAYVLLYLAIGFTAYASMPITSWSGFIVIGYGMAILGGISPDFDGMITQGWHRHPITHSGLFVIGLSFMFMLSVPVEYLGGLVCFIGLLLGASSHLIFDNFKSQQTLADAFLDLVNFKGSPGDIRNIKEERERHWLIFHFIAVILCTLMLFGRLNQMWFFDFPVVWDGYSLNFTPVPTVLAWIVVTYYLLSFALMFAWRKEKKKRKRRKK